MFSNMLNKIKNRSIKKFEWHNWFSWYPVWYRGTIFWLETIERRFDIHADKQSMWDAAPWIASADRMKDGKGSLAGEMPYKLRNKNVWHYRNLQQ